ncbi:MAG: hypothetical protein IPP94_17015 [Ignavibacteria bacterium]|nr:hypothetical protein [Ignavibacteria bacterium]
MKHGIMIAGVFCALLSFVPEPAAGQQAQADSLEALLAGTKADTSRVRC